MIDDNVDGTLQGAFRGTDPDDATRATAYCRARLDGDALGEVMDALGLGAS